jgi:hypothetical protein
MKIAWGVMVGDARGKTGTVCATLTRSGPVLRGLFRARQSKTQAQLEMRAAFGSLSSLWADPSMNAYRGAWVQLGLDHPEQNLWNADIYKTGLQWFIRANKNRQTVGESIILEAPAFAAVGDPGALSAQYSPGSPPTIEVSATQEPSATQAVVILATRGLSMGILTLSHQQRKIFTELPVTGSPWAVGPAYIAKFGNPVPNKNIFFQAHYLDVPQGRTGLTSWCIMDW